MRLRQLAVLFALLASLTAVSVVFLLAGVTRQPGR